MCLSRHIIPAPLPDIEQVSSAKILGVMFSHALSPTLHISAFLTQCNQRLCLLSQLKYQNLSSQALDIIFQALILSKITPALQSFAGHISSSDKNRINNFFRKPYRRGLVRLLFDIDTLIHKFDQLLFRSVQYPHHCLHHYFLKNAPLTILGNSDLEVMITLSAISILPPSKMRFLIDVCYSI